jgi:hypothetical protein
MTRYCLPYCETSLGGFDGIVDILRARGGDIAKLLTSRGILYGK